MMLTIILDLYFQLTPQTMVANTPEVQQLARRLKLKPADVVQALEAFQTCDPYLNRNQMLLSPLVLPCQQIWQRFGNHEPNELSAYVEQLMDYFV